MVETTQGAPVAGGPGGQGAAFHVASDAYQIPDRRAYDVVKVCGPTSHLSCSAGGKPFACLR